MPSLLLDIEVVLEAIRAVVRVFLPTVSGRRGYPNNSFNFAASLVGGRQAVPVQT